MTGRVIVVASGKGGVGKTWFAISLAQALALRGRRVALLDADTGLANADVQLGLAPKLDIGAVLSGKATLADVLLPHPAGFHLLPGRSGSGALADAGEHALTLPRRLGEGFRDVVVDLGAGIGTAQRRMLAVADLPLLIATEEPTSLTDAYAVLKMLAADAPTAAPRLVVNMAASHGAGQHVHATLDNAARKFLGRGLPLAGVVRRDAKVRDAIRAQVPLLTRHPTTPAAADVTAIAARLG